MIVFSISIYLGRLIIRIDPKPGNFYSPIPAFELSERFPDPESTGIPGFDWTGRGGKASPPTPSPASSSETEFSFLIKRGEQKFPTAKPVTKPPPVMRGGRMTSLPVAQSFYHKPIA